VPTNKQDLNQFGSAKPTQSGDPQHCAQCEAMLTDALDGTLSPADQAAFDLHLLSCTPCSSMTIHNRKLATIMTPATGGIVTSCG